MGFLLVILTVFLSGLFISLGVINALTKAGILPEEN